MPFFSKKKAEDTFEQMKTALYNAVYAEISKTVYKELNEKIQQIIETQDRINQMQNEINNQLTMVR